MADQNDDTSLSFSTNLTLNESVRRADPRHRSARAALEAVEIT